jgi:AraC-like DNA-binding protein
MIANIASLPIRSMAPRPAPAAVDCNILVVNDDAVILPSLRQHLKDICQLFIAKNEKTALHAIETRAIHLIVIHSELNYADGSRLCARLKSSVHYSHIPVILLIPDAAHRLKSLESGADACIECPFAGDYIRAQIRNLLANRARIKDYFAHSVFAHMSSASCSKENELFLNKLNELIYIHLRNVDLNVDTLARLMNMSRPTFYRKIKCISDLTPNELVNVARLNKAAELLSTADFKVSEVVKMVGFNSQSNFGKAFLKQFHSTPTQYQDKCRRQQRAHA